MGQVFSICDGGRDSNENRAIKRLKEDCTRHQLQRVFECVSNGQCEMTREVLLKWQKRVLGDNAEALEAIAKKMDVNEDGRIDENEFVTYWKDCPQEQIDELTRRTCERKSTLLKLFNSVDVARSGYLSEEELYAFLSVAYNIKHRRDAKTIVAAMDPQTRTTTWATERYNGGAGYTAPAEKYVSKESWLGYWEKEDPSSDELDRIVKQCKHQSLLLLKLFNMVDTDRSNQIDKAELFRFWKAAGNDQADAEKKLRIIDKNHDNQINQTEWMQYWENVKITDEELHKMLEAAKQTGL